MVEDVTVAPGHWRQNSKGTAQGDQEAGDLATLLPGQELRWERSVPRGADLRTKRVVERVLPEASLCHGGLRTPGTSQAPTCLHLGSVWVTGPPGGQRKERGRWGPGRRPRVGTSP